MVFLVEGSASVERYGIGNFRALLDFVRNVTVGFSVSRTNTRVAVVVYGTRPEMLFGFNSHTNNGAVFNRLNRGVKYPRSGARVGRALDLARTQLFSRGRRRVSASKVVVVITDGRSMDDVRGPSNALKGMGVRIYCVGVGRYIHNPQLDIMSSTPRKTHIFVADWPHLGVVVNELKNAICLGETNKQANKTKQSILTYWQCLSISQYLITSKY